VRLKLTLSRPSGATDDILVVTEASALVGDIARSLADADPAPEEEVSADRALTLSALDEGSQNWTVLPRDAQIGEDWIGSGSRIALADAGPIPDASDRGPAAARLQVLAGPDAGQTFALPYGTSIVGRNAASDVVLSDRLVSGRHLRIEIAEGASNVENRAPVIAGSYVDTVRIFLEPR